MATTNVPNVLPTSDPTRVLQISKSDRMPCYLNEKAPLSVDLYDELVTVIVGQDNPKTFHVHKGLLIHYCSYFAGAFNGQFIEAETKTVRLDQDDPDIFQLVYNYMYTGQFYNGMSTEYGRTYQAPIFPLPGQLELCRSNELPAEVPKGITPISISFKHLFDLYVFADMRGAPRIEDTVLSLTLDRIYHERRIPIDLVQEVHDQVSNHTHLMSMLASIIALCVGTETFFAHEDELPHNFLLDVIVAQKKKLDLIERQVADSNISIKANFRIASCTWHIGRCDGARRDKADQDM